MARKREVLRDPGRADLLRELADDPYSVARLLRAEHLLLLQNLDDDVRASKRIVVVSVASLAVNIPLSLLLPWVGVLVAGLGMYLMALRWVYEWWRGKYTTGTPGVPRSLHLIGGIGALPVSFLRLAERRPEPPHKPFLASSSRDDSECLIALELVTLYQAYLSDAELSTDEQEVFDLLWREGFSGSLAELTATAQSLTR